MIHNIVISWPSQDHDVDLNLKDVKGDTILLNVTVDQVDLSAYKIRCEVTNGTSTIELANEASGGSDDQIVAVDSESSMSGFQVIVPAGETTDFSHYGWIEIEVEDTNGYIYTIFQQRITFLKENIDWNIPE